jgi:hypothetical protein
MHHLVTKIRYVENKSFANQVIFSCEKYNKIDFLLSLYIIGKGPKNGGEHALNLVCLNAN